MSPSQNAQPSASPSLSTEPPQQGCTRSKGFWTNRCDKDCNACDWPAAGETTEVCGSASWCEVLRLVPRGGNAWIILAKQWIAAKLNAATGASVPGDVASALDEAETLLNAYCADKNIPKQSSDRSSALDLALTLSSYNVGENGPGYCVSGENENSEIVCADEEEAEAGDGSIVTGTTCKFGWLARSSGACMCLHGWSGDACDQCASPSVSDRSYVCYARNNALFPYQLRSVKTSSLQAYLDGTIHDDNVAWPNVLPGSVDHEGNQLNCHCFRADQSGPLSGLFGRTVAYTADEDVFHSTIDLLNGDEEQLYLDLEAAEDAEAQAQGEAEAQAATVNADAGLIGESNFQKIQKIQKIRQNQKRSVESEDSNENSNDEDHTGIDVDEKCQPLCQNGWMRRRSWECKCVLGWSGDECEKCEPHPNPNRAFICKAHKNGDTYRYSLRSVRASKLGSNGQPGGDDILPGGIGADGAAVDCRCKKQLVGRSVHHSYYEHDHHMGDYMHEKEAYMEEKYEWLEEHYARYNAHHSHDHSHHSEEHSHGHSHHTSAVGFGASAILAIVVGGIVLFVIVGFIVYLVFLSRRRARLQQRRSAGRSQSDFVGSRMNERGGPSESLITYGRMRTTKRQASTQTNYNNIDIAF